MYKSVLTPWVVVLGGAFLMAYIVRGPGGRYIVTDKENNKISYHPISNPNDVHVMTFDDDTTTMGLYRYLNVGDTITGAARKFSDPVVKSTAISVRPPIRHYIIETVNGTNLDYLRNVARRDSVLRDMGARQK